MTMGASAISIEAVIAATAVIAVIALLISPFSAIVVIAVGIGVIVSLSIWGGRAKTGQTTNETVRARHEERADEELRRPGGQSGTSAREPDTLGNPAATAGDAQPSRSSGGRIR